MPLTALDPGHCITTMGAQEPGTYSYIQIPDIQTPRIIPTSSIFDPWPLIPHELPWTYRGVLETGWLVEDASEGRSGYAVSNKCLPAKVDLSCFCSAMAIFHPVDLAKK